MNRRTPAGWGIGVIVGALSHPYEGSSHRSDAFKEIDGIGN